MELTDEVTAKMASENVPELLVSLFIQLEKPIKQARTSRTLEMLVRAKDGVLKICHRRGPAPRCLGEGEILIKVNRRTAAATMRSWPILGTAAPLSRMRPMRPSQN